MYEYKFINLPVTYAGVKPDEKAYQTTITEHAREGWRLVQIFIPIPAAIPTEYTLIFERINSQ